jgi:hypothetical protein
MKAFKALLLIGGLAGAAFGGPVGPPGGAPILNQNFLQPNATFYVPNGVVTTSFRLPYLVPGICTTTQSDGKIINTPCGGGAGASKLGVNWNGVSITTPTFALNAKSPIIVTAVGAGTTAEFTLDGTSVTLQGQNVVKLSSVLTAGTTIFLSSGTIVTFNTNNMTAAAATFPNGLTSNGTILGTGQIQIYGVTTLLGPVISSNYGYTMPDNSVMTSTGNFVWNGSNPQTATANISSMSVRTALNLPYLTPGQCHTTDSTGKVVNVACGGGAASLALSSGSATNSVIVSTPTGNIIVDSNTFIAILQGSTSAFLQLNPSSVTLQGNSISIAGLLTSVNALAASTTTLSVSTAAIQSQVNSIATDTGTLSASTTSLQSQVNGKGIGTITGVTAGLDLNGGGTSGNVTLNLSPGSTQYIRNTSSLQSGSTFYVSSGTVAGPLSVTGTGTFGNLDIPGGNLTLDYPGFGFAPKIQWNLGGGAQYIQGFSATVNGVLNPMYFYVQPTGDGSKWGQFILSGQNGFYIDVGTSSTKAFSAGTNGGTDVSLSTTGVFNVLGSGGLGVTYGVNAGSMTGAGLTTCTTMSYNATTGLFGCAGSGGGGSSTLAVTTGTSAGFSSVASSPTAVLNANSVRFSVTLQGSATAYLDLLSSQTFSTVQITSNTILAGTTHYQDGTSVFGTSPVMSNLTASQLVRTDANKKLISSASLTTTELVGVLPAAQVADLSATYLTNSSATATYLQQSSATATYLQQSSATATYLQQSSATATYLQQSSATATYLQQSSATVTYLQKSSATLTYLTQSSATASYCHADGANCTASGGGSSSLETMVNGVQVTSPTPSQNFINGYGINAVGSSVSSTATVHFNLLNNSTNYAQNYPSSQQTGTVNITSATFAAVQITSNSILGPTTFYQDGTIGMGGSGNTTITEPNGLSGQVIISTSVPVTGHLMVYGSSTTAIDGGVPGTGGGTPASPTSSVQFNNGGSFGGSSSFTYSDANGVFIGTNTTVNGFSSFTVTNISSVTIGIAYFDTSLSTTNAGITLFNGAAGAAGYVLTSSGPSLSPSWKAAVSGGGGGGASTLETMVNGVRVTSPTASQSFVAGYGMSVNGTVPAASTAAVTVNLLPNATGYAQNYPASQQTGTINITSATFAGVQVTSNVIAGQTTAYANGYLITPSTVNAFAYAGGGLGTCGSTSQALSYTSGGQYSCTTITPAGIGALTGNQTVTLSGDSSGSGATAITVMANPIQANIKTFTSSITVTQPLLVYGTVTDTGTVLTTTNTISPATTAYADGTLAVSAGIGTSGNTCVVGGKLVTAGCANGTLTANQSISVTGDSTGSGTTAITLTAAANQPNIITLSGSSITVKGVLLSTQVYHSSSTAVFDEYANGNLGATPTIDWTKSNKQAGSVNATITSQTWVAPAHTASLILRLATVGAFTVAWPASVKWSGGTAPTVTTTNGKSDIVACLYSDQAAAYYCSWSGNF